MGFGRKSILSPDSKKLILKQIKNDDTQTPEEIHAFLFIYLISGYNSSQSRYKYLKEILAISG